MVPQTTTTAHLYVTSDSGLHWRLTADLLKATTGITTASNCAGRFGDMTFPSPSTGWISITRQQSAQPEILLTVDGGTNWKVQRLPRPAIGNCPCYGVVPLFFDASRGILQVSGDQWGPALYATSDGGQTWRPLPSLPSSGYPLALDFVDANNFWAIVTPPGWTKGNSPTRDWLYRSSDGGGTWKLVQADLPIGFPVSSLLFIDANHGFAAQEQGASTGPPVGSSTEVLATSDGGHTWKLVGQIKGS